MPYPRKILVISSYDIRSPAGWSGTPHYCVEALKDTNTIVEIVSPLCADVPAVSLAKLQQYRAQKLDYAWPRDLDIVQTLAEAANEGIDRHRDADAILTFSAADAAFLDTDIPIGIMCDATWLQFTTSYSPFMYYQLCQETRDDAALEEKLAFRKATWLFAMTNWAADGVKREYPEASNKVHVVYPGANIKTSPEKSEILACVSMRQSKICNILFVGVQAVRKGFDIALQACNYLRNDSIEATLNTVGLELGKETIPNPCLRSFGFLRKDVEKDQLLLRQLYRDAFVLVLPARAECAGIVLCEAAAFGLPTLTSGVGGTAELISDGQTGFIVAGDCSPKEYAEAVKLLWLDRDRYRSMCELSLERYSRELNWGRATNRIIEIMGGFGDGHRMGAADDVRWRH